MGELKANISIVSIREFMNELDVWKYAPGVLELHRGPENIIKLQKLTEQDSVLAWYESAPAVPYLLLPSQPVRKYEFITSHQLWDLRTYNNVVQVFNRAENISNNDSECDTVIIPMERYMDLIEKENDLAELEKWLADVKRAWGKLSGAMKDFGIGKDS